MKRISLLLMVLCSVLSSCGSKSEEEIKEMMSSGVVLVQNQSYYEAVLSTGESLYFTGFDEDGDLTGLAFDEDSVELSVSYGTGFFVSRDGEIATNSHVVSDFDSEKRGNASVDSYIAALRMLVEEARDATKKELEEAQEAYDYANYSPEVSYEEFYLIRDYRDSIAASLEEREESLRDLDMVRPGGSEIIYHNLVSIAYNNTHVTDLSDFFSCVVLKNDPEHDLAIIQLKDKDTPSGKYIFAIEDRDPLETYNFKDNMEKKIREDKNGELYMMGFNLGPGLAITDEGLKAQFNSGSVSQKTADRLMYSIPALHGSSGSPVVNRHGQLVAINFAGLDDTQSFNYGVRVKHLKRLMSK